MLNMKRMKKGVPSREALMDPIFQTLKQLGGSGTNDEIYDRTIESLHLPDEILDIPHNTGSYRSEVEYQMAWAKTYMKSAGVLNNSVRGVWTIAPNYINVERIDSADIVDKAKRSTAAKKAMKTSVTKQQKQLASDPASPADDNPANDEIEYPEEIKPWKDHLSEVLKSMDPYAFERLAQRVLRECGFSQVEVTKKSGDGGIDGTGKLKINGIFSFNVAFQCKRYKDLVGAGEVRDFRGSLSTDIEKGVMITTGTFSKAAKEEACSAGKKQIDLVDGEEFMSKLAQYKIGVNPVITYEVDEEFFKKI